MGRKALCQKHFETLRPLLFYPKNTLPASNNTSSIPIPFLKYHIYWVEY